MASISGPFVSSSEKRTASGLDGWLIGATIFLVVVGLMSIYSEGVDKDGLANFRKQLINTCIGVIPMLLMYFVKPQFWYRASSFLYVSVLGLLGATLAIGKDIKGSQRWIDIGPLQFQPSDPAKLLAVMALAAFFAKRLDRIHEPKTFWLGLAHIALPIALILKQPHLAAAILLLVTGFAISLVAGTPIKFFGIAFGASLLLGGSVLLVPSIREQLLHGYQRDRIEGLLNKKKDAQGSNWQTEQAEIAFGVGGLFGTGFLNGKQKALNFIPEQRNDFVFTVLGEEGGLVACGAVLLAYGIFYWRVFMIMLRATDPFNQMMAAGIFAVLGFHTVVNLGMVLQLLPVAGMWLPFMSSGGTAIWLCLACVGLLLNIKRQEEAQIF